MSKIVWSFIEGFMIVPIFIGIIALFIYLGMHGYILRPNFQALLAGEITALGLRKAGATRAANNGATVAQIEAIYGWSGGKMASLYTRQADRVKLAREAIGKLSADKS